MNSNLQCLDVFPKEDLTTLKTSNLKSLQDNTNNPAEQGGLGSVYSGSLPLHRKPGANDITANAYRQEFDGE